MSTDAPLLLVGSDAALAEAWALAGFAVHRCTSLDELPERACGLVIGSDVPSAEAFAWTRAGGSLLQAHIAEQGRALLIALVQLDGRFGYNDKVLVDPDSGAIAGLLKTALREWPGLHARVLDVAHCDLSATELVSMSLRAGPVEIGLDGGPHGIALAPIAKAQAVHAPLQPGEALLISGGGRGVTATVAIACAKRWRCHCVLLGRSALPEAPPQWLLSCHEPAAVKRAIIQHEGLRKPAEVEARSRQLLAARELHATMDAIRAAGGSVSYHSLDIRDRDAVAAVAAQVREQHVIRGFIHGAGVLHDRWLLDQSDAEFDAVYGTKVDGLDNLLAACAEDDLRLVTAFSSSTARFGRSGQVAYAMGNEAVNKRLQDLSRRQPNCRVLSMGWGPWDGGMVTSSLKALFQQEGIQVIPQDAGAICLVTAAMSSCPQAVERVILGAGSKLDPDDPTVAPAAASLQLSGRELQLMGAHIIGGQAVLPLAEQARLALRLAASQHPRLQMSGFRQLRLHRGLRLPRPEAVAITAQADTPFWQDDDLLQPLRLYGPEHPLCELQVLLRATPPRLARVALPLGGQAVKPGWYDDGRLFHKPPLQLLTRVQSEGELMLAQATVAEDDPLALAVDAVLQLLILWSWQHRQLPCLPTGIMQLDAIAEDWTQDLQLLLNARELDARRLQADASICNVDGDTLVRLRGIEAVSDHSMVSAFRSESKWQE